MPPSSNLATSQDAGTPAAPNAAAGERPRRLLLRALLWLLAAEAASICAAALVGFVGGISRTIARAGDDAGWHPTPLVYLLASTIVLQAALLLIALKQGRSLGRGNLARGLGAAPMRRHWRIAAFAGLMIAWVLVYLASVVHVHVLQAYLTARLPSVPAPPVSGEPLLLAVNLLLLVALAPVAEELFFRGWLWTALRRTWGVWPTALCTACLWLGVHALNAPVRALALVPMAIMLSLARHQGGSMRASLVVHVANNATAVAIQVAALLLAAR